MSQLGNGPGESVGPVWGAPPPAADPQADNAAGPLGSGPVANPGRKKMSPMAKTLSAVGVAAVLAVGGTVAVTAANASSTSSAPGQGPGGGGMGYGPGGEGGGGGFGGGSRLGGIGSLAGALHGEFVVSDSAGGTTTKRLQTGSVTAVSSTSITVKSTDNFQATYAVGLSTSLDGISTGNTVTVIATVSGSTATVDSVSNRSSSSGTDGGAGGMGPGGTGDNGGPPAGGQGQTGDPPGQDQNGSTSSAPATA